MSISFYLSKGTEASFKKSRIPVAMIEAGYEPAQMKSFWRWSAIALKQREDARTALGSTIGHIDMDFSITGSNLAAIAAFLSSTSFRFASSKASAFAF